MVGAVSIVAAYANREALAMKIRSVYVPATPKPVTPFSERPIESGAFTGSGSWALSALPECFVQRSRITGPRQYVFAHLPRGAVRVPEGVTVTAGDCRVFVRGGDVWAWRGKDRLRVPAPAALFRQRQPQGLTIALLQGSGKAFDLRLYDAAAPNL